jgi:Mitochondrial genome maintenance MGM101
MYRVIALRSRSHVLSRSTPSIIKKTLLAARVSTSQTNSINGNTEAVDSSYPTVTREIETDIAAQSEIINNIPAEGIPSSGVLVPPPLLDALPAGSTTDWSRSYHGLSTQPFPPEVADILLASIDPLDIEMKPGTSFVRYPDCRCR